MGNDSTTAFRTREQLKTQERLERHLQADGLDDKVHGAFDRLTQIVCLGVDGKPAVCNEGYAVCKLTYDRYGRVASERNYDVAGKPCALPSTGCFGWNAEYDRLGKETSRTWIGVDGKPCACKTARGTKKEAK